MQGSSHLAPRYQHPLALSAELHFSKCHYANAVFPVPGSGRTAGSTHEPPTTQDRSSGPFLCLTTFSVIPIHPGFIKFWKACTQHLLWTPSSPANFPGISASQPGQPPRNRLIGGVSPHRVLLGTLKIHGRSGCGGP